MGFQAVPCNTKGEMLNNEDVRLDSGTEISQICRFCLNRENALFRDLTEAELLRFGQFQVGDLTFSAGETLYRQGDPASAVYMVRDGLIKLEQFLPDGSQRIVRLVKADMAIALEAMLGNECQHQAVALKKTKVCKITLDVLHRIESETPRLHKQLMTFWHTNVSEADTWLTHLSTGSARARMARLLLLLSDGVENFEMLSREDIGAMLGITTETASRMIAEFRRLGAISPFAPRRFTADRDLLLEISGVGF